MADWHIFLNLYVKRSSNAYFLIGKLNGRGTEKGVTKFVHRLKRLKKIRSSSHFAALACRFNTPLFTHSHAAKKPLQGRACTAAICPAQLVVGLLERLWNRHCTTPLTRSHQRRIVAFAGATRTPCKPTNLHQQPRLSICHHSWFSLGFCPPYNGDRPLGAFNMSRHAARKTFPETRPAQGVFIGKFVVTGSPG